MKKYSDRQVGIFVIVGLVFIGVLFIIAPKIMISVGLVILVFLILMGMPSTRAKIQKAICKLKGHDFSPSYEFLGNKECKKSSTCKRCTLIIEEVIPHDVADAKIYFEPTSYNNVKCAKYADCKNCGKPVLLHTQEHDVSNAQIYFKPSYKDCEKTANCTNCGQPVKLSVQQHVEQPIETACETGMKCQNCGNIRISEDRHQYKFVSQTQVGPKVFDGLVDEWVCDYNIEYKCERCGQTKIERNSWAASSRHLGDQMTGRG